MTTEGLADLLTSAEVREALKVSKATLWRWREEEILRPIKIGPRTLRYRRSEVEALISGDAA